MATGCPSLAHAAEVLRSGGSEPNDLLRLVTLNYALGNVDAHAKNISFLRHDDGTATMAPAYDIAMHTHHNDEAHRSALDINAQFSYSDIGVDDLIAEAGAWGLPSRRATRVVTETLDAVHAALGSLDPSHYPGVSERAWETVHRRVAGR